MSEQPTQQQQENVACQAVAYQSAQVSVPVSVQPFAIAGATKAKCCGTARVVDGSAIPAGVKGGICNFTISDNVIVEIPVSFGAVATVGDTYVNCLGASDTEIDCTDTEQPQPAPQQ